MRLQLTWMVTLFFVALQFSFAQQKTVKGTVTDGSGLPLPGVTVLVKGTTNGTQTDFDGNYSISVESGKTLSFSYVGMTTVEKKVGANTTINVVLKVDAQELDAVVVTGVGVATSKRKVAIAVQSVDNSDMSEVPSASIDQALTGKIAGARISSSSGQPGQQASILLRGINSLGSTQPMILVDGVQINAGSNNNGSSSNLSSRFADLDLSNVDRVEVIQGAAAGTIYGAQGANGVIQIFTKKGKKNQRVRVSLNSQTSFSSPLTGGVGFNKMHYFSTDSQGYIIDDNGNRLVPDENGIWPQPSNPSQNTKDFIFNKPYKEVTYNHIDTFFKNNVITSNNSINLSGGGEFIDTSFNLSRLYQESVINGDYTRYNVGLNVGFQLSEKLNIRSHTKYVYSENTTGSITGEDNVLSGLGSILGVKPYFDLKFITPQGYYVSDPNKGNSVNPFYIYQFREYLAKVNRFIQSLNAVYKLNKYFEFDYKFGYDSYTYNFKDFIKYQKKHPKPSGLLTPTEGKITYDVDTETLINSLATLYIKTDFEKDFGWILPIQTSTQLSYDYRSVDYKNITTSASLFSPFPPYNLNTATEKDNSEYNRKFITFGYLINQKLDYSNLFGLSVGFRVDYSSAFGAGSDPFIFPRGDAYFRVDQLFTSDLVNELKVRAAYGEAGIQPGAYDRFVVLSSGNLGTGGVLYMPSTARNPNLGVQVSKEKEIGLDLRLKGGEYWFRNISINSTYWKRKSEDIIRAIDLAPSSGTSKILDNALTLSSSGVDVSLDATVFSSDNFEWDLGVRFGTSKTFVDKISNGKDIVLEAAAGQFILREGEQLGVFFGKKPLSSLDQKDSEGKFYIPVSDRGEFEIVNGMVVNKETLRVVFTDDQYNIGNPNPDFTLSFFNNVRLYHNLSIGFQLEAVVGNNIYNGTKQSMYRDKVHSDFQIPVTINNKSAAYYNYYDSLYDSAAVNSYFVEDGSFIRLRDLSLSYDFSPHLNGLFNRLSFSLSGRNLLTFTKYSGFDPEAGSDINDPVKRGVDRFVFPNVKTYQVGINLEF